MYDRSQNVVHELTAELEAGSCICKRGRAARSQFTRSATHQAMAMTAIAAELACRAIDARAEARGLTPRPSAIACTCLASQPP